MHTHAKVLPDITGRAVAALLLLLAVLLADARVARGGEVIPSVGLTRQVNGSADTKLYGGIAVRGDLLPVLQDEIAISYRDETQAGGLLRTRMWPVTASLWFKPLPLVYAGAGAGWYNITYHYDPRLLGTSVPDETRQRFGVHVGGGLRVPLAPAATVDLNGRYVMMRNQQSRLVPEHFDPDFWTATLGLGFHF